MCEVLELVVVFITSSSSPKTNFVCKTYRVFSVGRLTGSSFIDGETFPIVIFFSFVNLQCSLCNNLERCC